MRLSLKRISALVVSAVMVTSLAGCNSGGKTGSRETGQTGETQKIQETQETKEAGEFSYPMDGGGTVTYWMELNPNVAANYTNMGETHFAKKLQADTGISIEYQHPAVGQGIEQFNLLLSNRTLPDIIEYGWFGYAGGPQKAIEDSVIIPLNDIIDQYCPNFKAYLEANPEVDKMIKTDDGTYYCFPFIRGADKLMVSTGPMLREDWLQELNLEIPTTIDEWYEVLSAFKNEKGAAAPFTYQYSQVALTDNNPFANAFGAPRTFYLGDDGKVHYGAIEDGYKEYLQTMNQWMAEGLIDVDLATLTGDQVSAKITNGSAGAAYGYCGSGMGTWINSGKATDEKFSLAAAPWPVINKGDKPQFAQKDNAYVITQGAAAITTSCENVELAARLLDYAYGKEGNILYNFGEEGVSYTVENGEFIYTDELLKNPNLSITHAMAGYIRANYNGPFVQDERYATQYYQLENQKKALEIWSDTNAGAHVLPPITPTVDESQEQARIMNEVNTYRDEMTLKFILGNKGFDEWDDYVKTIKDMNIDRVLEIQNSALERYNSR